ncbi:unnamed protein product, partial [Ectocarpus sp. 13 AM-2016]
MCARIAAQQRQRASAARRLRQAEDERRLESLVAGRTAMMIRPLDLSVNNHLQQLRASVDASWSSFSTAWDARRARGSGSGSIEGGGLLSDAKATSAPPPLPPAAGFVMPPCTHRGAPPAGSGRGRGHTAVEEGERTAAAEAGCPECAAIAAAHVLAGAGAATTGGRLLRQQQQQQQQQKQQQQGRGTDVVDVWAGSSLGVLNADALHRALTFLQPRDLLELAQASRGAREAADSQLVWREVWWARFGAIWESEICKKAARRWHLYDWNPKSSAVTQRIYYLLRWCHLGLLGRRQVLGFHAAHRVCCWLLCGLRQWLVRLFATPQSRYS